MKISTSDGSDLDVGSEGVAELAFLADEARPWVEVGSEFHLVVPPRRVGRGRVTRVLESGARNGWARGTGGADLRRAQSSLSAR